MQLRWLVLCNSWFKPRRNSLTDGEPLNLDTCNNFRVSASCLPLRLAKLKIFNLSPLNTYFSKIFRKYIITENYKSTKKLWIWTVKIDWKSATPDYDCFHNDISTFSSVPSRSKEEAKGSVAIQIFEMASLDIGTSWNIE